MNMLAFRQDVLMKVKNKNEIYNKSLQRKEKLNEIELEIIVLVSYLNFTKSKLD
jgi:hypothetical protein